MTTVVPLETKNTSIQVSNTDMLNAIFGNLPHGGHLAICRKQGDPSQSGGWVAERYSEQTLFDTNDNNYFNTSSFRIDENGTIKARKQNFCAMHALMLDDVGTKIPLERLGDLKPSTMIETSPGNYQMLLILDRSITDIAEATQLQKAFIAAGLCDPGASGACRWARLPVGINGKQKYQENGQDFQCRLHQWNPEVRYSTEELLSYLGNVEEKNPRLVTEANAMPKSNKPGHEITYMPKPKRNPVIDALVSKGMYKKSFDKNRHDITCPWVHEHTDSSDNGTAYFEPTEQFPLGGFCCQHSHGDQYSVVDLLGHLDINEMQARYKSMIVIRDGELHTIVDAVDQELGQIDDLYQMKGLLVQIGNQSNTQPVNQAQLTLLLAKYILWLKYDGRRKFIVPCDPPARIVSMIVDGKTLNHVKPLKGIAMQPYYSEKTDQLVLNEGYDVETGIYGSFDAADYTIPEPTIENARRALAEIQGLLSEFQFASEIDQSAAISMLLTAVVRPSLALAPGFLVKASMPASGKSYLCALAGALATPGDRQTIPYPKTADESKKVMLSLLIQSPAVIEFDDLDDDIKPHTILKQALTSEYVTDRILGQSKTATVSTRTLFLFSGNNVEPLRDLRRRIISIHLQRQEENPTTTVYKSNPVQTVMRNRAQYIVHFLTIIESWKNAGCPRGGMNVVTYGNAWSDYCRHPLVWLGLPDPVEALINQVTNDPDLENLGLLLDAWHKTYGSAVVTIRRVVKDIYQHRVLDEAISECPVSDQGAINSSKFGWFLKKNMNRIVNGLMFVQGSADGRLAWQVVAVNKAVGSTPE